MPKATDSPSESRLIRDGSEEGYPTVAFDRERRQAYHLDSLGRRCYHDVPPGFAWNEDGTRLVPQVPQAPPEPPESPAG